MIPPQLERTLVTMSQSRQALVLKILDAAGDHFGASATAIRGRSREHPTVHARWAACWLLHRGLGLSSVKVADIVNHDHSTVLNATKAIDTGRAPPPLIAAVAVLQDEFADLIAASVAADGGSLRPWTPGERMTVMAKAELHARVDNDTAYHPPSSPEVIAAHQRVRVLVADLGHELIDLCPEGRDLSLALTAAEDVMHWANAAIAKTQLRE